MALINYIYPTLVLLILSLISLQSESSLSLTNKLHDRSKVHPKLKEALKTQGSANIFLTIQLGSSAVLHDLQTRPSIQSLSRSQRLQLITEALKINAAATQQSVLTTLKTLNLKDEPVSFWITNQIYIQAADETLINALEAIPEVTEIFQEEIFKIPEPILGEGPIISNSGQGQVEWGIQMIQANLAWAHPQIGNKGANVTVANIDTGVRGSHSALSHNFIGPFGWFDPYTGSTRPEDANGHGSHVMGTMVGAEGIGVAPGAKWMGCRGCGPDGSCTLSNLIACGQFIACPNNGTHSDCSKAPDLVCNSWGGAGGNGFFKDVIQAWHLAGIIPIFANGNEGSGCRTSGSPGDYENVISVGATTYLDDIAIFSSRGPSKLTGGVKPDVSGPGHWIRSAWYTSDEGYNTISGTSMAAPHAAGIIALLKGAEPTLTFDQVREHLIGGVDKDTLKEPSRYCGSDTPGNFPNNVYGHGRINALKSLKSLQDSRF